MTPAGFLNVVKPPGMTSHDVVATVRRRVGGRKAKVGHLGTLDPAAAGVLPLAVGKATKLIAGLPDLGSKMKGYLGQIQLGVTTSTDDLEGEVLSRCEPSELGNISQLQLEKVLSEFRGDIQQVPPSVSAIRKDGKRAYKRVLAGEEVKLDARAVSVGELTLRSVDLENARFEIYVECGSGTYIRSLARDIGSKLGVGGALAFLLRTHSGPFHLEAAASIEEIISNGVEEYLLPCEFPFEGAEVPG